MNREAREALATRTVLKYARVVIDVTSGSNAQRVARAEDIRRGLLSRSSLVLETSNVHVEHLFETRCLRCDLAWELDADGAPACCDEARDAWIAAERIEAAAEREVQR